MRELKLRVTHLLLVYTSFFIILFIKRDVVIRILLTPLEDKLERLIYTNPTEALTISIVNSLVIGLLLLTPLILIHVWLYLSPSLYRYERKKLTRILIKIFLGILIGILIAYKYIVPMTYDYLISFVGPNVDIETRVSDFCRVTLSIMVGVIINIIIPIVLYELRIKGEVLKKGRAIYYGIIVVILTMIASSDREFFKLLFMNIVIYEGLLYSSYYRE